MSPTLPRASMSRIKANQRPGSDCSRNSACASDDAPSSLAPKSLTMLSWSGPRDLAGTTMIAGCPSVSQQEGWKAEGVSKWRVDASPLCSGRLGLIESTLLGRSCCGRNDRLSFGPGIRNAQRRENHPDGLGGSQDIDIRITCMLFIFF